MFFGEFTPKPGKYEQFNDDIDQCLGDYFLEAEARLVEDLLDSKPFDHFKSFLLELSNNHRTNTKIVQKEFRISGKVQKVGFRQWVQKRASELQLNGFVENLSDGSVRLVVQGSEEMMEKMRQLSAKGPERAIVKDIVVQNSNERVAEGFSIYK